MRLINRKRLKRKLNRLLYKFTLRNIKNRNELPHILNSRGLTAEGAEIGVYKGQFSEHILKHWNGKTLYSIDPWMLTSDIIKSNKKYNTKDELSKLQEEFFFVAKNKLLKFGDRSKIIRLTSVEASNKFNTNQLDFVYIDAQHDLESIKEDINIWYPKVKSDGIICGHDYLNGIYNNIEYGVKSAVDEFVEMHKLSVGISKNLAELPSWFIIKP